MPDPFNRCLVNIVAEIQKGNRSAFEEVYHQCHERMYFFVVKQTGSTEIAEEIIQQSFIKLWETKSNLSLQFSIETQIARIVKTTLIDFLRKKAVERKVHNYLKISSETVTQTDPLLEKELVQKISAAVNDLPPVCRKVFILSRQEGLSHKEIARQLLISPKSVENHIAKALKFVRKVIS